MEEVKAFLSEVVSWASKQDSVLGILLAGSYARDAALPDSDVDLVLLSNKPIDLLANSEWLSTFGEVISIRHADYGLVQSQHVLYKNGLKVEYGITTLFKNINSVTIYKASPRVERDNIRHCAFYTGNRAQPIQKNLERCC